MFALSLSATPLPFIATVEGGDANIVGPGFSFVISPDIHIVEFACPLDVPCDRTVTRFAATPSDTTHVSGTFNGQSVGIPPLPPDFNPVVTGEFGITLTGTLESGLTEGQIVTVPADFFATIHSAAAGLDLRFQGSGPAQLVVESAPHVVSLRTSVFSGFVEQPEQAQIPEPPAWQLAGIGLLLPVWRRIRPTRRSSWSGLSP